MVIFILEDFSLLAIVEFKFHILLVVIGVTEIMDICSA